ASLGMWQLDRARQKTQLQDSIDAMAERTPLTARELAALGEPSSALHRRVSLSGHWVSDATLFLDNRQMLGRTGFFVVTPLRLQDQGQVVLVQRGWVPRDFQDRARVPLVPTPPGTVRVEGRLAALMPLSVVQTDDTSDGLLRNWPVADTGVHKHHGYAFQWFGLCALAGFLFVWFQIISPRRRQRPHVSDT
ncbi:MAG: SURF1 family protein, partial [Hydrogenophaga sp.]|nr:SURF1 family protein [Hydrogenophaga sp.]